MSNPKLGLASGRDRKGVLIFHARNTWIFFAGLLCLPAALLLQSIELSVFFCIRLEFNYAAQVTLRMVRSTPAVDTSATSST